MNTHNTPTQYIIRHRALRFAGVVLTLLLAAPASRAADDSAAVAPAAVAPCPHGADKANCYLCTPALREAGRLWCREHGRYEDRCWLCHPDVRDPERLYCEEHFLYEDECSLCRPDIVGSTASEHVHAGGSEVAGSSDAEALWCQEHDLAEAECGLCHPELADGLEPGSGLKIRFRSAAAAGKAGVEVAVPTTAPMGDVVECHAEVIFNQNKLARVATPGAGVIREIAVDLGSRVNAGDVLATVSSAAIGAAKGELLRMQAEVRWREQQVARERKLRVNNISSERDHQEAVAAHEMAVVLLQQARQELLTLGFDATQIARLSEAPEEAALLELRAPFAGEITERSAVLGSFVEAGETLFTLVDRSTMWAILSIREEALGVLREGQPVELSVGALGGAVFPGVLSWISAEVDDRTRLARARVEVANPDGLLKAHMFGRARILLKEAEQAIVLPGSAIQYLAGRPFAFVKLADDLYEARALRVGSEYDGQLAITAGLRATDQVVVGGGFVVKSQFLISRLGAGCAH